MNSNLSFGCEHEWADFSLDVKLPMGCQNNRKDHTIVNSNGIANDPKGITWRQGGEINTPPTSDIDGQVQIMESLIRKLPQAKVNYRSNLHVHIRVPGLRDDLKSLKQVQEYIHLYMPEALRIIEPIPEPLAFHFNDREELNGAMRRYKRRKVSHHTLLTAKRLDFQLQAKSPKEFFVREVPSARDGRTLWHLQPRLCVSLRQMLETDTIEFRHWPGTLDHQELFNCFEWCRRFIIAAMNDDPIEDLLKWARQRKFPVFPPYVHWQEVRYRATVHDGTLSRDQIIANIYKIKTGMFDGIKVGSEYL